MAWDDCLTEEQKVVTKYVDTNACLLAGPGTGKTRCITQRVVYLIEELDVPCEKILILTFTRKAAAELRCRVTKALGTLIGANISTLHAYALTQLLRNSSSHSLPKPLRIADDYEQNEIIIKDLMKMLGYSNDSVKKGLDKMSSDWQNLGGGIPERKPDPKFIAAWNTHRILYGYTLRSELVYQLNKGFEEYSILPESYEHIIVDEYQDLNPCELKVIKTLASKGGKLYVAGDDDQSIYSFRNSEPEGIRKFSTDYPGSKDLRLVECMRSTPEILSMGNYIIEKDLKRISKKIIKNRASIENSVKVLWFNNEKSEAKKISELCSWLVHEKKVEPKEIILLLRNNPSNIFSKPIIEEMLNLHVPVIENTDLTEIFNVPVNLTPDKNKLGRIFLSYLRLIHNNEDQLAWRTILELENNGIGIGTISDITKFSEENELSFYKTLKLIESGSSDITKRKGMISRVVESVEQVIRKYSEDPFLSANDLITNLAIELIQDESVRDQIVEIMDSYFKLDLHPSLENLLKYIFMVDSDLSQDQQEEYVRIMTMHQAKGLDAKIVIIIGVENELVPGRDSGANLSNALRLLYVSVTRARDYLLITHCSYRSGPQGHSGSGTPGMKRSLSRFISGGPVKPDRGSEYIDSVISKSDRGN